METSGPRDVESLIVNLGVTFGYCLSPDESIHLTRRSFDGVEDFLDSFLQSYGSDPARVERRRMRELETFVRDL